MNMIPQGTDEWRRARLGCLTASRLSDAIARTKTGWGASRTNLMAALTVECLTGEPQDSYQNTAMQWGVETEPDARIAYEFYSNATVGEAGFVLHPTIARSGASPDGFVGDDGLLEIKCPQSATHIDTLLGQAAPEKYVTQMQWQMACTGRAWCDFVSFDPRMPEEMRLFVVRVPRDESRIFVLQKEAKLFLDELAERVEALRSRYSLSEAA